MHSKFPDEPWRYSHTGLNLGQTEAERILAEAAKMDSARRAYTELQSQMLTPPRSATERLLAEMAKTDRATRMLHELRAADTVQREMERLDALNKQMLDHERIEKLLQPSMQFTQISDQVRLAREGLLQVETQRWLEPLREYRLLQADQVRIALEATASASVTAWLERERQARVDWSTRLTDMVTPWARLDAQVASVRALAELNSVGAAMKAAHPFEADFTQALRGDFGDWRNAPEPGESVLVDLFARREYYVDQGFDTSLTDFEEPAFAEGLESADLCVNYLVQEELGALVLPAMSPEEQAAHRRAVLCFELLRAMEFELRKYIHRKMVAAYGDGWEAKRLGQEVLAGWKRRFDAARQEGRTIEVLIEAADFTEYEALLMRKDHFNQLFAADFGHQFSIQESFKRLRPLRLDTMHARPVSREDLLLVVVECRRIHKAIRSSK